jgi:uncharacterized protein YecT (DUF1311 family)
MKLFALLIAVLATVGGFSLEARAQSQAQMNQEAFADFKKADQTLNKIYPQVLAKLDTEGQEKLKAAQRAWVSYRDAQAELEADQARGGSLAPLLRANSMTTTTEERIKQLREFLKELNER